MFSEYWECARVAVVSLTPPAEADVRCLPPGNTSALLVVSILVSRKKIQGKENMQV